MSSVEVPSWHRDVNGVRQQAGEIKAQFLLNKNDITVVVKASSAHNGHSADKRKELSAKARILSYSRVNGELELNNNIFLVLVLDGEWRGASDEGRSAIDMLNEAGWDAIVDIDNWEYAFDAIINFISSRNN